MADTKISALTANSPAELTNEIPINDSGATKKISVADLQDLIGMKKARLTADHSISSTTATEVTDLQLTLVAGIWMVRYNLIVSAGATTTGLKFGINYTGTVTRMTAVLSYPSTGTTAATGVAEDVVANNTGSVMEASAARTETTTAPNLGPYAGVAATSVDILNMIDVQIEVSDGGDLELWHGSEVAASSVVESGSSVYAIRIP